MMPGAFATERTLKNTKASQSKPMRGIYLTAVLTTTIAVAIFGVLIHKLRTPANERLLWLAAALALPL